jgi:hypothetical protein
MKKKLVLSVMLTGLLALGLVFSSCDNGTNGGGGGGDTGTFRIRITDIPSIIYSHDSIFGLFLANTTTYSTGNALGGRDTTRPGDDSSGGPNGSGDYWFEFSIYTMAGGSKYVGPAGNYDIGVIDLVNSSQWVLKDVRLEVNTTNTFAYSQFGTP